MTTKYNIINILYPYLVTLLLPPRNPLEIEAFYTFRLILRREPCLA